MAEDERNLATLAQQPPCGDGLDAIWADDFHHQMRVALTGDRNGYFADYSGVPPTLRTIRQGWFYRRPTDDAHRTAARLQTARVSVAKLTDRPGC